MSISHPPDKADIDNSPEFETAIGLCYENEHGVQFKIIGKNESLSQDDWMVWDIEYTKYRDEEPGLKSTIHNSINGFGEFKPCQCSD